MIRLKSFCFVIFAAFGALYLTSLRATSQVNAKSVMMVQGTTPGVSQSGHTRITGKMIAGGLEIFDPSNLGVRFTSDQISFASSNEDTTYRYNSSPESHQFFTAGTLRATISSTGLSGVGTGLTALNATNVSTGTLADARLSAFIPRLNTNNTFTGNMGIGVAPNTNRLRVSGNAEVSGTLDVGSITINPVVRTYVVQPAQWISDGQGSLRVRGHSVENSALSGTSRGAAAIHLPQGAKLTEITVFVLDNAANDNMIVKLIQFNHTNPSIFSTVASVIPAFDSSTIQSVTEPISSHVVDNHTNYYLMTLEIPNTTVALELHTIRLKYTMDVPLP